MNAEQAVRGLPEGRYGRARGAIPRRWRMWIFSVIALLLSGAAAYVAYLNLGTAPIEAQRVGFAAKPNSSMEITIDVIRDEPSRPGVCIVRVRDVTGAESGRKEIFIPAGGARERLRTVIRSIGEPVTADVFGCSYDIPRYLSSL